MKETIKSIPFLGSTIKKILAHIRLHRNITIFKKSIRMNNPIQIVIGASGVFDDDWIPSDIEYFNILHKNDWNRFFEKETIDAILSEHVWEHLTSEEGALAARNCHTYLRLGGNIRIAVPDGYHPDEAYIDQVRIGGTGAGADDHKMLYNYKSLSTLFEQAGFQVTLLEYFDEEGVFHAREWDALQGMVHRSARYDKRNQMGGLKYTSIIMDARRR